MEIERYAGFHSRLVLASKNLEIEDKSHILTCLFVLRQDGDECLILKRCIRDEMIRYKTCGSTHLFYLIFCISSISRSRHEEWRRR